MTDKQKLQFLDIMGLAVHEENDKFVLWHDGEGEIDSVVGQKSAAIDKFYQFIADKLGWKDQEVANLLKTWPKLKVLTEEEKLRYIYESGFYLRDDTEMRKDWDDVIDGDTPAEAYSLCTVEGGQYPFQRIVVLSGNKTWAINRAIRYIATKPKLTTWKEINL